MIGTAVARDLGRNSHQSMFVDGFAKDAPLHLGGWKFGGCGVQADG
jgi:hypothetical protein